MRSTTTLLALAASLSVVSAVHQGFNYGSTNSDGSIKDQQRFQDEFNTAKKLVGAAGFNSARLYTSIQGGTANDPIAAIPAAIESDTTLLLGIWASAGQDVINNEIAALKTAIAKYGDDFTSRVVGLSVGSEDLYRISPTGIAAHSGAGATPDQLVSYISEVRSALAGTALKNVPIGHVDTWNDWVNGANRAVIDAVDWCGVDAYPYFQTSMDNTIENGPKLFFEAYDATVTAAGGKDVWITETGWPVGGPDAGKAKASLENAKSFWDNVACRSLGKINTFWYTLQDAFPVTPSPSFGIVGTTLSTTPLFDLSCPAGGSSSALPSPTEDVSTIPVPTAIPSSGGGLTPSHVAGNAGNGGNGGNGGVGSIGTGSGNVSSTLTTVPSGTTTGIASPTGGAGGSDGAGSASPTGGAGTGSGSESGSAAQPTGSNGTVVSPAPTSSPTPGTPNAAAANTGAGALALGAAIVAAVAAF